MLSGFGPTGRVVGFDPLELVVVGCALVKLGSLSVFNPFRG